MCVCLMPSHTYHKCVYVYINTRKRECCCCCCCCCVFPLAWIHQTKTNLTEGRDQQTGESCCLDAIFFLVSFMYVMWASIKRRHSSSSLSLSLSGTLDEELLNFFFVLYLWFPMTLSERYEVLQVRAQDEPRRRKKTKTLLIYKTTFV